MRKIDKMKSKVIILGTMLCASLLGVAQDVAQDSSKLGNLLKIECSFTGVGLNYELPVGKKLSLDNGVGLTAGVQVLNDRVHYEKNVFNPSSYVKSELKYYYNRHIRIAKKLPTSFGQGSYFGYQSKFMTQRVFDDKLKLSNILMCEGHWGVQRVFSNNWMINFHIGLGRAFDFTTKGSSNYMAFGLKVAYFIRKMK